MNAAGFLTAVDGKDLVLSPSFDESALHCDVRGITLRGCLCTRCDTVSFPARECCARCHAPARAMDLPATGTVTSHCEASFPIAGALPPVTIAQVRLGDEAVEILGVCAERVQIGDAVVVVPRTVCGDGENVTTYGFEKVVDDA